MKTIKLGSSSLEVPVVAVGCMRINSLDKNEAERFVQTALEQGANFFDHADIYGGGTCEEIFADAIHMNSDVREQIILQSKCGIRQGMFDFSKEHILNSVDGILKRLKTDYLDVLLLHRPDALVEPEEVAEAFEQLESSGKVRHFGVSNQNPMQIQLLKKFVKQPIVANQLQLSITNATMISAGINVNMENESAVNRDGSVLDFCRLNDITVQPWSPFQYGFFEGVFLGNDKFPELNKKIDEIAGKYGVTNTTIAIAWLLRHPANMQPVIGTMNLERLQDCIKASDVTLTREEWYEIYRAAGNILP
ncbi:MULTISPECIES: aldo/keto reductase [Paenibacillus]|uniref:Aldo/keto reductase n=2 Tax=Paenibacillus TaxID=44249 RepID=A0A1R1EJA9_9BACL|nr:MULTISPECIES: aldo/keto reductase family oxidoreductase [Paenibacillus]MEC0178350.1 aldo/keto reductase family oxidoreductase [Paenibacillus favisporus]OMF51895.1 aldo/keto reductase [Paenibacillus rhizosphaerae]OXL81792.1 aldo/keto reductase [Paenibacillus sp. SSG-1]PQP85897.1 aldo/keto reductase [Paenibacillus sp. AR247]UYO04642.1 aldo/keto reductase family oxidoreductase [Paenibacillus sp. PSB04]